jgi:hypothetical protein
VLNKCGLVVHQGYNQLLPSTDAELAEIAKNKKLLGYHDIRLGNQPDTRLSKFITVNLPSVLATMRPRWDANQDLIEAYVRGPMRFDEFSARVRRRHAGEDENGDLDYLSRFDFDGE